MAILREVTELGLSNYINQLFASIDNVSSVEEAAQVFAKGMYTTFKSGAQSELVLSRVFHSFEYQALPQDIQEAIKQAAEKTPDAGSLFLTLLGTYGDEPAWQDRTKSSGHKALPLTPESITKIPMMTRLFQQIGFDLGIALGKGSPGMVISGVDRSYSVFYVDEAQGSPYIPAQEFVTNYGVKTIVGSGVKLPNNDISIYIGFTRISLNEVQALHFSPLMSLFWQKVFPVIEKGFFS